VYSFVSGPLCGGDGASGRSRDHGGKPRTVRFVSKFYQRPRRRLVLIAVLALIPIVVGGVVLQGSLTKRDVTREQPLAASLEVCYDDANDRLDVGCATTIVVSRAGTDPVADAVEILELSRSEERYAVGCHSVMHALGQQVAKTTQFNQSPEVLSDLWSPCGYGLLHGVFEKIVLPPDPAEASQVLRGACEVGGIRTDERLHRECLHALGHAVYDYFGQGDEGYEICATTFPGKETSMTIGRTGCFSGLAMKSRDALLQRILDRVAQVEPTVAGFANAGRICSQQDDPEWAQACAPGFVQVATEYGASHMPAFLQWCSSVLDPAVLDCYRQAGVYMGHFNNKFRSLEEVMTLCGENESGIGTAVVDMCRASVAEGLKNIGLQAGEAVDRVCQIMATIPRSTDVCTLAREIAF
jgi:hypothetical protein